jgi:hypothetical protein
MKFPSWVQEEIAKFEPPSTGKVTLSLEFYQGGVTRLELGPTLRVTPKSKPSGRKNNVEYEKEVKLYKEGKLAGEPAWEKEDEE